MDFNVTIEGDKDTIRRLGQVGMVLDSLPEAMKEIGHYLVAFYAGQVFASQGGVIGEKWPRLSPRYEVVKAKHFPGRPMLVRTGLLQRNFKFAYSSSHTRVFNPTTTANGYNLLGLHQNGTRRMPARAIFGINATMKRYIASIIADHVSRKLENL